MSVTALPSFNRPIFARHETFHPRYGWLRKAVAEAARDHDVFIRPDATVQLGVGKNMVSAIRYWGQAFKLLDEVKGAGRTRLPKIMPTALGRALLGDDGWDPYLEAEGTLWLLHWWLLRPPTKAPVWWLTYNCFQPFQFSEAALARFVVESVHSVASWSDIFEGSIKKDVDCLIRMYSSKRTGQPVDDLIDCPFRDLGLLEGLASEARTYRFVVGPKPSLPDAIVAHATLDFIARANEGSTMSLARLAHDVGGPGRIFKLTETALHEALQRFAASFPYVVLADPAGMRQVLVNGDAASLANAILHTYYRGATGSSFVLEGALSSDPAVAISSTGEPDLARSARQVTRQLSRTLSNSEDQAERQTLERAADKALARVEAYLNG